MCACENTRVACVTPLAMNTGPRRRASFCALVQVGRLLLPASAPEPSSSASAPTLSLPLALPLLERPLTFHGMLEEASSSFLGCLSCEPQQVQECATGKVGPSGCSEVHM